MHTRKRTTNLPKFNQELSLSPAKKAVSTWNLIKHEKAKFIEFMSNNFCSIYDLINILLWKLYVIKKLCQIQLLTSCKEKKQQRRNITPKYPYWMSFAEAKKGKPWDENFKI